MTTNTELLKVDYNNGSKDIYTMDSVLAYVCDAISQDYEIYHNSDSGSIYARLINTSKDGVYVQLRVSDHDVLSRGNTSCLGGADVEIIFRSYDDVYDLDDEIEFLLEDIEDYIVK